MKKVVAVMVVGFVVYYLMTAPAGAAESVRTAFSAVVDGFGQVLVFVENLFT